MAQERPTAELQVRFRVNFVVALVSPGSDHSTIAPYSSELSEARDNPEHTARSYLLL
jgi:hypothetical protein